MCLWWSHFHGHHGHISDVQALQGRIRTQLPEPPQRKDFGAGSRCPKDPVTTYTRPMESTAYTLGNLDAVLDFGGTKEAWARALAPLAGMAIGAALAPEDERLQGAALGGLGAWGLQSAVSGALKPRVTVPSGAPPPPVSGTRVLPRGVPIPTGAIPEIVSRSCCTRS